MTQPLVNNPNEIRLAMLGMIEGNGHPYSWSAIINGEYDADVMAECGYPVIPQYLGAQPRENLGIAGVKVTHVWCDDPQDTQKVARATMIPNTVERAEDVIGHVDAVVIATDNGSEHIDRVRPFIEAGIPAFIDKPLTDRADHLQQFIAWMNQGKRFMSSSGLQYAREYADLRQRIGEVGEMRVIHMTMAKTWERYGIHALGGLYDLLEPGGWQSVSHRGDSERNIMYLEHQSGVATTISQVADLYGGFGHLAVIGTKGLLSTKTEDTFYAFKTQLEAFVTYLRTGKSPIDFAQTVEQMKIIIAGLRSREQGGRTVYLKDILDG